MVGTRRGVAVLGALMAATLALADPAGAADPPLGTGEQPAIIHFWLVDADTDARLFELTDEQHLLLPFLPAQLSIEAEANGATGSVILSLDGVDTSTESFTPYALGGDDNGDFAPVTDLRTPGWATVSARPYAGEAGAGTVGATARIELYRVQPDFVVDDPKDNHDWAPGDGLCTTAATPPKLPPVLTGTPGTTAPATTQPPRAIAGASTATTSSITGSGSAASTTRPGPAGPGGITDRPPVRGCTLRAAVEEANALAGDQLIMVDGTKGPYHLTQGQLSITSSMWVEGWQTPVVVSDGWHRVLHLDGGGDAITTTVLGFDLSGGDVGSDQGGVVRVDDNGFLRIFDTTVRDGRANYGGGLYVSDAHLLLADSAVRDNAAGSIDDFEGGGFTQRGGGIANEGGLVEIARTSVFDNEAIRGGGIVNENEGRMSIVNSSVLDNRAGSFGGGIANLGGPGTNSVLDLRFVTITGNQSGASAADPDGSRVGGGLFNLGLVRMSSSIVAGNLDSFPVLSPWRSPDCYSPSAGGFVSQRYNTVGALNDLCLAADDDLGDLTGLDHGTVDDPLDPAFTARFTNSGQAYYNLLATSPAVDTAAGPGAGSAYPCPVTDQRGFRRPVGAGCDRGAVERQ